MGYKKYLYFFGALIVSTFMFGSCSRPAKLIKHKTPVPTPIPTVEISPTDMPSPTPSIVFTCPASAWVNCMPSPDSPPRPECQSEFLKWAHDNCPGFQGAAL